MVESAEALENAPAPHWWKTLDGLERRYGVFRVVRFALASGTGFLVNEAIVVLGIIAIYHAIRVPGSRARRSPSLDWMCWRLESETPWRS